MGEFDKPTGKYVPLAKRIKRMPIITNEGFAGKILYRPDVDTLHSINLKKHQDKIRDMPEWNWYEESYNRLY
jgi:hypothetical protein